MRTIPFVSGHTVSKIFVVDNNIKAFINDQPVLDYPLLANIVKQHQSVAVGVELRCGVLLEQFEVVALPK